MPLHIGREGPCAWTLGLGSFDDADVHRFVANLRALAVPPVSPHLLVLDILHGVPMPTAVQRKLIVGALRDSPALEKARAHALVSNSPVGRGVLTAINWVVQPKFDEAVFSKPSDALAWLSARSDRLDGARVLRAIRDACPAFDGLRW